MQVMGQPLQLFRQRLCRVSQYFETRREQGARFRRLKTQYVEFDRQGGQPLGEVVVGLPRKPPPFVLVVASLVLRVARFEVEVARARRGERPQSCH